MKIIVADDRRENGVEIERSIKEGFPDAVVENVLAEKLVDALEALFNRVKAALNDAANFQIKGAVPFDGADLVIVDNNLAELAIRGARLTAESIAGYIRAFADCAYVVSLNKNTQVDFDLRYLVGDYQTHADVALNTKHLLNRGLWTGDPSQSGDGFRPWYWPQLGQVSARRRAQIEFVQQNIGSRVIQAFGIPNTALDYLSLHAKGALSPQADTDEDRENQGESKTLKDITFTDIFLDRGERSIAADDERRRLHGAAENPHIQHIIARVVAADLDLWFRRDVLGPQESLVDVPHLVSRLPFLLGPGQRTTADWNKALEQLTAPFGLDGNLYEKHLAGRLFAHGAWVPSACFWWSELKNDETLNKMFGEARLEDWADALFCEDRSRFLDRKNPAIMEFAAEFEGSYVQRHVGRIKGVKYAPLSRFAR